MIITPLLRVERILINLKCFDIGKNVLKASSINQMIFFYVSLCNRYGIVRTDPEKSIMAKIM